MEKIIQYLLQSVVIPIEDNHLFEAKNENIYVSLLAFSTDRLKPFDHNIIRSVPKEFRNGKYKWSSGTVVKCIIDIPLLKFIITDMF